MIDFNSLDKKVQEPYMTLAERRRVVGALRKAFAFSEWNKKFRAQHLSENKGPRGGDRWVCEICGHDTAKLETHHIDEVIEIGKTALDYSFDEMVARIWCPFDNLQALCHDCHKKITDEQNAERKRIRQAKKKEAKKRGKK